VTEQVKAQDAPLATGFTVGPIGPDDDETVTLGLFIGERDEDDDREPDFSVRIEQHRLDALLGTLVVVSKTEFGEAMRDACAEQAAAEDDGEDE
jgi:hypothetical protein